MAAVLNDKFDRVVKFSLTNCVNTHSVSINPPICCCLFVSNIKFNATVSLNLIIITARALKVQSSTRQFLRDIFLSYIFESLYLPKIGFKKSQLEKINKVYKL